MCVGAKLQEKQRLKYIYYFCFKKIPIGNSNTEKVGISKRPKSDKS